MYHIEHIILEKYQVNRTKRFVSKFREECIWWGMLLKRLLNKGDVSRTVDFIVL